MAQHDPGMDGEVAEGEREVVVYLAGQYGYDNGGQNYCGEKTESERNDAS